MSKSKQNIICLDLDDCIYPNAVITEEIISDVWNIKQLEINLWKLSQLLELTNSKVFIISSWAVEWILGNNGELLINIKSAAYDLEYTNAVTILMNKYLKGKILALPNHDDREKMVKNLDNGSNRLVIFDDYDLTKYQNKNVRYFETLGALNNIIIKDSLFFLRHNAKIFSCDVVKDFKPYCKKTIVIRAFDSYHEKLDKYPKFIVYPDLKYKNDFYGIINLYFDDIDGNDWKNKDAFKDMCISDDAVAFTKKMAANLLESVYRIANGNLNDFDLVVHCRAGESRSAAIFIALNDIFDLGYDDLRIKHPKYNKQVLDDILNVYITNYSK